jgi:hypothetical protein
MYEFLFCFRELRSEVDYLYGAEENPIFSSITFCFIPLLKLESEVISINTTSPPMETAAKYRFDRWESNKIWQQTVINPSGIQMEKRIRTTIEDTTTETLIIDIEDEVENLAPVSTVEGGIDIGIVDAGADVTTLLGSNDRKRTKKGNESANTKVHTYEIEESFKVPAFTCAEVFIMTDVSRPMEQNVTMHLRISGKAAGFSFSGGIKRDQKWVPGIVVQEVAKEHCFKGVYVKTRETDAIYEISGRIRTRTGLQSSFLVQEVECPITNSNQPDRKYPKND